MNLDLYLCGNKTKHIDDRSYTSIKHDAVNINYYKYIYSHTHEVSWSKGANSHKQNLKNVVLDQISSSFPGIIAVSTTFLPTQRVLDFRPLEFGGISLPDSAAVRLRSKMLDVAHWAFVVRSAWWINSWVAAVKMMVFLEIHWWFNAFIWYQYPSESYSFDIFWIFAILRTRRILYSQGPKD